jgi:hypothetical protein
MRTTVTIIYNIVEYFSLIQIRPKLRALTFPREVPLLLEKSVTEGEQEIPAPFFRAMQKRMGRSSQNWTLFLHPGGARRECVLYITADRWRKFFARA